MPSNDNDELDLLFAAELRASRAPARKRILTSPQRISEDFVSRLRDRAHYRALLANDSMDAERFRWYFSRLPATRRSLDEWREAVDRMILEEQQK